MDFELGLFAEKLKEWFVNSALFPYYEIANTTQTKYGRSKQQSDKDKHPNRTPTHLKDVAKQCVDNTTFVGEGIIQFDYGNAVMEHNYPHYHILEDNQVIKKRGKGTKKTKGSQDQEKILAKRDYGKVSWNGKTFTKEYSRNVRGSRNRFSQVSHWSIVNGQGHYENADANAYLNTHYKYIENILDQDVVQKLASYFELRPARKIDGGLGDEYFSGLEEPPANILDIIGSFE